MIERSISIEDLLEQYPAANRFLSTKGIRCIACGEPIWGTLEEAMQEKDFSQMEMDAIMQELNMALSKKTGY